MFRKICIALIFTVLSLNLGERANAEPITIAALGDSLVQGYGLAPADGFVPQLQNWLTAQGHDLIILNAGVSGDTSAGGVSRIGWTLTPEVDALILSLGANDVLRGIDPATTRANLKLMLETAGEVPVLLVGIAAPSNYGPAYKEEFDAIYGDLSSEFNTLLYANFLGALLMQTDRQQTLATYFQPDALHPNASGVALIVDHMGASVIELADRVKSSR